MDNNLLEIKDLHVNAGEKEILKGIDLDIKKGEWDQMVLEKQQQQMQY